MGKALSKREIEARIELDKLLGISTLAEYVAIECYEGRRTEQRGLVAGIDAAVPLNYARDTEGVLDRFANRFQIEGGKLSESGGIDFTIGDILEGDAIYYVRDAEGLTRLARQNKVREVEFRNGKTVLQPGRIYYVITAERARMPLDLDFVFDSKSTSARLGILCDNLSGPTVGDRLLPFVASVRPYAFPVEVEQGRDSLHQGILIYKGSPAMSLDKAIEREVELWEDGRKLDLKERADGFGLRMSYATNLFLRARKEVREPIVLSAPKGSYKVEDYFEVVDGNGEFMIEPGDFVLGATQERIMQKACWGVLSRHVPKTLTGLTPHLAGFINPYWGGTITTEMMSSSRVCLERGMDAMYVMFHELSEKNERLSGGSYAWQEKPIPQPPRMFEPIGFNA